MAGVVSIPLDKNPLFRETVGILVEGVELALCVPDSGTLPSSPSLGDGLPVFDKDWYPLLCSKVCKLDSSTSVVAFWDANAKEDCLVPKDKESN